METNGIGLFGSPSREEDRNRAKWSGGRMSAGGYQRFKENLCDGSPSLSALVSPTYSPLTTSTRFNINHKDIVRADAMSSGYVSRIAEAVSCLKVGQFPSIQLASAQASAQALSPVSDLGLLPSSPGDTSQPTVLSPRILLRAARPTNVKVRIASPLTSTLGIVDKSLDEDPSETLLNNSTKTVIQVLKEISKKRVHIPTEDWSEGSGSKRLRATTQHNLCMSQLETTAQIHSPPPPPQSQVTMNGKRGREEAVQEEEEAEKEVNGRSSEVVKRARTKSYSSSLNNEIISSLSSSVNITPPHLFNKRKARASMCSSPVLGEKQKKKHSRRSPSAAQQIETKEDNIGKQKKLLAERAETVEESSSSVAEVKNQGEPSVKEVTVVKPIVKAVDKSRRFTSVAPRMINTLMPPPLQQDVASLPPPPANTEIVEKVVTRPMVNALLKSAITKFVAAGDASLVPTMRNPQESLPPTSSVSQQPPSSSTSTTGLSSTAPVIVILVTTAAPSPASTTTITTTSSPPATTITTTTTVGAPNLPDPLAGFTFAPSTLPAPQQKQQEAPKIQFGSTPQKSLADKPGAEPNALTGSVAMPTPLVPVSMKQPEENRKPIPTFSFGTQLPQTTGTQVPPKPSGGFGFSLGSTPGAAGTTAPGPTPVSTAPTPSLSFNTTLAVSSTPATSLFTMTPPAAAAPASTSTTPSLLTTSTPAPATSSAASLFTAPARNMTTPAAPSLLNATSGVGAASTSMSTAVLNSAASRAPTTTGGGGGGILGGSAPVFSFGSSSSLGGTAPASVPASAPAPSSLGVAKTSEAPPVFAFGSSSSSASAGAMSSTTVASPFGSFSGGRLSGGGGGNKSEGGTAAGLSGAAKIFGAAVASVATTAGQQGKSSPGAGTRTTPAAPAFGGGAGIFGASSAGSLFGQKKEEGGGEAGVKAQAPAPVFGSSAGFGATSSLFATATTTADNKGGGGGFAYTLGSNTNNNTSNNKPTFCFGSQEGRPSTTTGMFGFGGAAAAPLAQTGNNNNPPAFGAKPTPPAVFGSSATTFGSGTAFGSGVPPPPAFGAPSGTNAATPGVFGCVQQQQPEQQQQQTQDAGGNKGAFVFGSSGGFSQPKPFNFGSAPTAAPSVFSFGQTPGPPAQQPQQSTPAFQFSATPAATPATGFSFNAPTSTFPLGANNGQQMFSIGSGSTAPRARTIRTRRRP